MRETRGEGEREEEERRVNKRERGTYRSYKGGGKRGGGGSGASGMMSTLG